MKLSNVLVSRIKPPLFSFYGKNITLLLDDGANVLDIVEPDNVRFSSVAMQLRRKGNVLSLFDFGGERTISGLLSKGQNFVHGFTESFIFEEIIDNFYTLLPVLRLSFAGIEPGLHLGVIGFSEILPNHFEKSAGGILYLDGGDRLVGFFHSFYELFLNQFKDPAEMLGQPAGRFFSPTPSELQEAYFEKARARGPETAGVFFEEDFRGEPPARGVLLSNPSEFLPAREGLYWEGKDDAGSYLTLPDPVRLAEEDFEIALEVDPLSGPLPFFMIGEKQEGPGFRDGEGYLLAIDLGAAEAWVKKRGFLLVNRSMPMPAAGPLRLECRKAGRAFFLSVNGKLVLEYLDPDFIQRDEAHLILYRRKGGRSLLKRLKASKRASAATGEPPGLIAKANTRPPTYFLLNRFYSFVLNTTFRQVNGYRFQDVTLLQSRIHAIEQDYKRERQEKSRLSRLLQEYQGPETALVGNSDILTKLKEKAARIAETATTVLIQGRTGTGKEVLARYIHQKSPRSNSPFVKVDCSTLPESLMEAELFGYEKGAFTGALQKRIGYLERGQGGTLFVDEVNNLSPEVQGKLLQFLNDFTLTRIGGDRPIKVNVRVIAASNQKLLDMVRAGAFREDLYYRIAAATLELPALSERMADLSELCVHFVNLFNRSSRKKIRGVSPQAFKLLAGYPWPGNIRELKNVVEQAGALCDGDTIEAEHLILPRAGSAREDSGDLRRKMVLSREELLSCLRRNGGVVKKAGEELAITPRALYKNFKRLGIVPGDFRDKGKSGQAKL